jgi:hypothetical protein
MSTYSYQLLPDDILLLVVEADFGRNGKSALPKWRLVNRNCCRLASQLLFKKLRFNFSAFLPSQKLEAAKAIHLLRCLDANPDTARMVKWLTLEGSFEVGKDNNEIPVLLRKVLSQMEKLELLHWDLTVSEARFDKRMDACVQSYTRINPEGFWISRSKTISELFQDVAAIPALNKLFLKMPWWEAAILRPFESQAEVHLLAEGAGIYDWKPQPLDELNLSKVFGQLTSIDITTQEYDGNSYVHTLLQKSQDTLQQLAFRSRDGLDYPEKHTDLDFPKLHTLVWEVYNPNPFDRKLMRLSSRHATPLSTFDNSKTFLTGFLKRHTSIRSIRIVFNNLDNRNIDAGEEYPAITSCAGPFIKALESVRELEFLQFVGLPVSWEFALSIIKRHTRLEGLWLPILEGSLEHSSQRPRAENEPGQPLVSELRQLITSGPQLKLLSLGTKKRWFQDLTNAISAMLKTPGMLDVAAVVGDCDLKRRLLFVSDKVCDGRDIEFWRSRDSTFAPVQAFNQIQLGVELPTWEKRTGSSVWLDEPEWNLSEDFVNKLKDDVLGDSVFDISRICRGEPRLSVTLK